MILFYSRMSDVQVMRTEDGALGVDNIGVLRQPDNGGKSPDWIWDICEEDFDVADNMCTTEKLCIIGMLDKLNGYGHRVVETRQARWREITGIQDPTL